MIIDEKLNVAWSCNGRIDILYKHKDLIPLMKKAGCWYMAFGIESGNKEVLKYVKKNITLEQVRDVINLIHKYGIFTKGFFIIGHPIDTKETINDTINFAKSLPLDGVSFNLLIPYYGTELYKVAQKTGKMKVLDYHEMTSRSGKPHYIAEGLTEEYLMEAQKRAYREFHFRPSYILRQVKHINNIALLKNYIKVGFNYFKLFILGGK